MCCHFQNVRLCLFVIFDLTKAVLDISFDPALFECFLNLPLSDVAVNNPVDFRLIHEQQNIGNKQFTKAAKYSDWYSIKILNSHWILKYVLYSCQLRLSLKMKNR